MSIEPTIQTDIRRLTATEKIPEPTVTKLEKGVPFDFSKFTGFKDIQWSIDSCEESYAINCGNKTLFLFIDQQRFNTYIAENNSERILGATTKLYSKAKELMQAHANAVKKSYIYNFSTEYPTMINWARTEGEKIFDWKKRHRDPDNPKAIYLAFVVDIIPENQDKE